MHVHSTASDGEFAPAEVVRRAAAAGLAAIALTDHDTIAGLPEAEREGAARGVRIVSGCEFSVQAPWGELHLLGYFLPPGDARLDAFLTDTRAARRRRGERMVARLQRAGVALEFAAVERHAAGGALGRPHVARALVEAGFSADIGEAFDRWIGRGRPAFVEKPLPSLEDVATLVHAVGGLTVAAHLGERGSEGQIRRFQDLGLDGVEVRHPSHGPATEQRLLRLAGRLGLAVSGGSDWHGEAEFGGDHAPLGGFAVPMEWLEKLEERRTKASNRTV
ncbi:MAG: PHP domain-containing protein [Gemmatimonadales bacterium]